MKKVIISLCCIGALAGCAKTAVDYEPTGEITFTPVTRVNTKAQSGAITSTTFPTDWDIQVWAFYSTKAASTTFSEAGTLKEYLGANYGAGVEFTYKGTSDDKNTTSTAQPVWHGGTSSQNNPYYWPKTGSLYFAGCAPYANTVSNSSEASHGEVKFELGNKLFRCSSWTQSNDPAKTVDLLFADIAATGNVSYSKNNVPMPFSHAMSWISIRLYDTGCEAGTYETSPFTITGVELNNVGTNGSFTTASASSDATTSPATATWALLSDAGRVTYTVYSSGDFVPEKKTDNDSKLGNNNNSTPNACLENTANGIIVIPQTLGTVGKAATTDITLTISYTQKNTKGEAVTMEPIVINLKNAKDSNNQNITTWESGKHYIYTIGMGVDEILIAPTVLTWTEVNASYTVE